MDIALGDDPAVAQAFDGFPDDLKSQYRRELAEALIDAWHEKQPLWAAARRAAAACNLTFDVDYGHLTLARVLMNLRFVDSRVRVDTLMPTVFKTVNNMLWDGAKTERVREVLISRLGGTGERGKSAARWIRRKPRRVTSAGRIHFIRARELTKQHDWNTCK